MLPMAYGSDQALLDETRQKRWALSFIAVFSIKDGVYHHGYEGTGPFGYLRSIIAWARFKFSAACSRF